MIDLVENHHAWFEKHRPKDISEVVFEDEATANRIKEYIENGVVAGNIISYGDGGTGKSTINQVIYTSIVKHGADIYKLQKSVKGMDDLRSWLLDMPQGSKQKIVVCEEIDRLSKEAQSELKDGLMEKFMPQVAFLATTNNIHALDPALLQRFNIKLNFTKFNIDGVFFRMIDILEKENVKYDRDEVYSLVIQFQKKGIRNLINALQTGTIKENFKLSNLKGFSGTSGFEDTIIHWIKYILNVIKTQSVDEAYNTCLQPSSDKIVGKYWNELVTQMKTETAINYDHIYTTLLESDDVILPVKQVFEKYYQNHKVVMLPHIHLQSAIFESMAAIYQIIGGEQKIVPQ